jgi:hypothetical protein
VFWINLKKESTHLAEIITPFPRKSSLLRKLLESAEMNIGCNGINGNTMVMPTTLPTTLSINQLSQPTTIPAFGDTFSGITNPPTCSARTCSSNSPNVVWYSATQLFTVQSLTTDLAATSTVTMTCSLTDFSTVPAISASF